MTGEQEQDPWLTYAQAAARLGVHKNTIRRAVRNGELVATRMSHRLVRIRGCDFDAWVLKGVSRRTAVGR